MNGITGLCEVQSDSETVAVRVATETDSEVWAEYVASHADANVFHRWEWRRLLQQCFGHRPHYLIAECGSRIVGVLPLAEVRSLLFGHSLTSLPFCSYAGLLSCTDQALKALLTKAVTLRASLNARHLEIRHTGDPKFGWANQDLYVYFRRAISADHDANLLAVPRKQRAMIRKGIKNGLTSSIEDVKAFYPLYLDNTHRHGSPGCSIRFFEQLAQIFGRDCEVLIVRTASGEAVSGVLSLYFRDEVFPFYAGDTAAARDLAANDFKYWEVMRRGVERNARIFNFGRSKRGTGSFDFKKNWGFEPTPLSYEFWLPEGAAVPQNNPLNPKYRLMIQAWRRMPRWIVQQIGPRIIGGLG